MTILFSDGFESGDFSAWDASGGSTAEVIGGAAFAGSFGAHFAVTGGTGTRSHCREDYTAPASNIVAARCRIRVNSVGAGGVVRFLELRQEGTLFNNILALQCNSGNWQYRLRNRDGSTSEANLSSGLSTSTWYLLTLLYDGSGANPVAKVRLDGTEVASVTDSTSGTLYIPNRVIPQTFETFFTASADAYYDAVEVHDADPDTAASKALPPSRRTWYVWNRRI